MAAVRRVPLEKILEGANEIVIVHHGQDYRLRITAKGKLILTK
ncbi:MAG: hemin uptake protein HemP [Hyphomicrobiaceae bacterium]